MGEFQPKFIQLRGGLEVRGPVDVVFPLFSPVGEESWVPGWSAELIHPPGVPWQRGQVFRTREEHGEAIWVVTQLDRERHEVEYYRVAPGRYVARVAVRCRPLPDGQTEVRTEYEYIGLSEAGNTEISAVDAKVYEEKMNNWRKWIGEYLAKKP